MRSKIFTFVVIVIFSLIGNWLALADFGQSKPSIGVQNIVKNQEKPVEINQPGIPIKLIISKFNVQADVESVGLDSLGRMDVPKSTANVGWYNLGFRPGEKGSAVIDGHLDTITGAPGVFFNLQELQKGNEIKVIDNKNIEYTFIVEDTAFYNFNEVPLGMVFNSTDKSRLNLITCGGYFNYAQRNYTQRIVVYSVLQGNEK